VLAAGVLAGLALPAALAGPAAASPVHVAAAHASTGHASTGQSRRAAGRSVSVSITSVNPPYATAGRKVTVSGSLTNGSPAPLSGVTVQLLSSSTAFSDTDQLQQYAGNGGLIPDEPEQGALAKVRGTLRPGATVRWTAVLPVNEVHMTVFGVYPLAAQATSTAGLPIAASRTFLPYWPPGKAARPQRDKISWLWPLIDSPDQGPCLGRQGRGQLLNNHLAASLGSGGRLAGLLSAGSSAAGQAAQLTWVVDPELLSSAQTMTRPYQVSADSDCGHATARPASAAAATWLAGLRSAVSGQPAFVTPYADVDIAGLTRQNLDGDVQRAFTEGRSAAAKILGRSFAPTAAASGSQSAAALTTAAAWPADGLANYTMLELLAAVNGIRTVVLSSSAMPPKQQWSYTPSEVTTTPDFEGGDMHVLLADSTLTQVLQSVTATSDPRGAAFAARQRFLAETAMIAAQAPNLSRAIVVAPPRRWDPPAGLASGLLDETDSAPWLSPVSAGSLAAARHTPGQVQRQQPDSVGSRLLGRSLLLGVRAADRGVQLAESIRMTPDPQLYRAVAGIESSAWRGSAAAQRRARPLLHRVTTYVSRQLNGVSLVGASTITLGGQKGDIPVAIDNRLSYPVQVRVQLTYSEPANGGFAILTPPGLIKVKANTVMTTKVKVQAASVPTTITMRLLAPDRQPLPRPSVNMTVQATHFGTFALIILAAALGIFVITSATRAIRKGRIPPGPRPGAVTGQDAPAATDAGGHEQAEGTDSVGPDRTESGEAGTAHVLTEDADDYARVPGWADRG
jgi:hypothetical protein